jgi:hypothetical protein
MRFASADLIPPGGKMQKQIPKLQPAQKREKFTIEEAARAFRQVRTHPKPELFDDEPSDIVPQEGSGDRSPST